MIDSLVSVTLLLTSAFLIGSVAGESVPDELTVSSWVLKGGVAGVLILVITAVLKGWLVPGYIHRAVVTKLHEVEAQNLGMVAMGGASCNEDLVNHLKAEVVEYKVKLEKSEQAIGAIFQAKAELEAYVALHKEHLAEVEQERDELLEKLQLTEDEKKLRKEIIAAKKLALDAKSASGPTSGY